MSSWKLCKFCGNRLYPGQWDKWDNDSNEVRCQDHPACVARIKKNVADEQAKRRTKYEPEEPLCKNCGMPKGDHGDNGNCA